MENGTVRIGSIVIDVDDFDRMMGFWQAALRYVPGRPPTPGDPFVILKDPEGKGPNVSIDGMPPERGRLHLDLYTEDQEGEVERLLGLGATRYRPREPGGCVVVALFEDEDSLRRLEGRLRSDPLRGADFFSLLSLTTLPPEVVQYEVRS